MPDINFPRLSSAELVSSFGGDQAALRRYRMLAALLREGRPPGEVARTFGVSRESLRRLRQAFERDGLAALRSQKRGGGHVARGSPLVAAIKQELDNEPGLAAPLLWRRVQARLHEQNLSAPRSSFYRLLTQLRDEERTDSRWPTWLRIRRWHWAAASWPRCCYPISATCSGVAGDWALRCVQRSPGYGPP